MPVGNDEDGEELARVQGEPGEELGGLLLQPRHAVGLRGLEDVHPKLQSAVQEFSVVVPLGDGNVVLDVPRGKREVCLGGVHIPQHLGEDLVPDSLEHLVARDFPLP